MSTFLKPVGVLSIVLLSAFYSCKNGLTDHQKLFLDYAKLEDKYNGTSFYRNFDLYATSVEAPVYHDEHFSAATLKNELKKSFHLTADDNRIEPEYQGGLIPFPHKYIFTPLPDGSYHVQLSVFIPDERFRFSLSHDDIGEKISKDGADITLLDMTSDGVTLLVENKNKRQRYDYTYDMISQTDQNGKEDPETPDQPGYHNNLFGNETLSKPNMPLISVKDAMVLIDYDRLNVSLSDADGKTLLSDGRINDFRHYLWYRNNDMPYPELQGDYSALKSSYIEEDKDPHHRFNPMYIVNIRALGKVDHVDFFLRGNKGHLENIDLGNHLPKQKNTSPDLITEDYLPIQNLTTATATKLLKVNYSYLEDLKGVSKELLLYASLPESGNSKDMSMHFKNVVFMTGKKDSVSLTDMDISDARNYFSLGASQDPSNLLNAKLPLPSQKIYGIKGKVDIYSDFYNDKTYTAKQLPKGLILSPDGLTITILKEGAGSENIATIYAFGAGDNKKPLAYRISDENNAANLSLKYTEKPATFIVRSKTPDSSFNQAIPFEITIEKTE